MSRKEAIPFHRLLTAAILTAIASELGNVEPVGVTDHLVSFPVPSHLFQSILFHSLAKFNYGVHTSVQTS